MLLSLTSVILGEMIQYTNIGISALEGSIAIKSQPRAGLQEQILVVDLKDLWV